MAEPASATRPGPDAPDGGRDLVQDRSWTPDALRAALAENDRAPHGRARIVRAEALLDAADRLAHPESQLRALHSLVDAYQVGGERFRSPVPFSRILRLWDRHHSTLADRDRFEHLTHWKFKWVTSDLLLVPEVPLATIRGFVDEMERRYRLAGHGLRAVHAQRFHIAHHVGDTAEAEEHHARWLAAERDRMSDCEACERNALGGWRAEQGADAEALALWAPTVENELTCLSEPAGTLAQTLKPLLRLGRLDAARSHCLRGYRLVRGRVELRASVGRHVEFCALSGNEGRGLEILAENRDVFDAPVEPLPHLEFLAFAALLLRRVVALGSADLPVPGPQARDWPAAELLTRLETEIGSVAERFDDRNGNDTVSLRAARLLAQTPLVDRLPLGVRSASLKPSAAVLIPARAAAAPAAVPPGPAVAADPDQDTDFDELLAEARHMFRVAHPGATKVWERLAALADRLGIDLDPEAQGQLAEERAAEALDNEDLARAVELLGAAIERYEEGGLAGRAVAVRARLLLAEALRQEAHTSVGAEALGDLYDLARDLLATGAAEPEDVLTVRRAQAFEARRAVEAGSDADEETALAFFEATVDALLADAEEFDMPARAAAAHTMRAEILQRRGDPEASVPELLAAMALYDRAARPWANLHPNMLLAQAFLAADRDVDAEQAGLAALAVARRWPEQRFPAGYTRQVLANATGAQGRYEDSAEHALEAVVWADRNGVPDLAASARHSLAFAYEQLGRDADAAAILESALPELVRHLDDPTVVNARWALARCLGRLEDYRGSAEQYLLAAAVAEHFPQQGGHAMLAASAGHALRAAGMPDEARRAFERAVGLMRVLPDPINLAKTLRALAWVTFGESDDIAHDSEREDVLDSVLLLFAEAAQVLDAAAGSGEYERDAQVIAYEIAETDDQLARLHLNAELADKAMPYAERAAAGFKALLPHSGMDYDFSEQMVAWLLDRYGSRDAALERLRGAIEACERAGVEAVRCTAFLEQLSD
ncbi:tetratricopeptide repeat protein [Catenulispora subtropica]|uniref:Tetratricopeptide repeat protein n=1 Tax=Catenulispora subtropica TaxID=450798 RepID=A0ABN2QFR9_9ACTN